MPQQNMKDSASAHEALHTATSLQDCVVFMGNCGQVLAASKSFAGPTKLTSRLILFISRDKDPVFLFEISFPLGEGQTDNENVGFGVKHRYTFGKSKVEANDRQTVEVRFPRGKTQAKCLAAPASIVDQFRVKDKDKVCILTVSVTAPVTIVGYGCPFRSADREVNSWVNDNKPIGKGVNLQTFLKQQSFTFLVGKGAVDFERRLGLDRLPPPFHYPYGDDQTWNEARLAKESTLRGDQFPLRYSHPDDLSHVTAIVQGTSQDIMWLNERRKEIAATKFSGYFVTPPDGTIDKATSLYLVIARTPEFKHKQAWVHLQKGHLVKVALFNSPSDETEEETWNAKIVSSSEDIPELSDHAIEKHELFLIVQTKVKPDAPYEIKCYCSREAAQDKDHKRRVDAANLFRSDADPVNFDLLGLPSDPQFPQHMLDEKLMTIEKRDLLAKVHDRMDLHRALLRGQGFYQWMSKPAPRDIVEAMEAMMLRDAPATLRPLPVVNFLEGVDKEYADAIVDEALPSDHKRLCAYLEYRPLGLGIATSCPGSSTTTFAAAATLVMQASLGPIFCSAPTNVDVDNFASRIDNRSAMIAARCNDRKHVGRAPRVHRRFVVRAYDMTHESVAFRRLLQDPNQGDNAAPNSFFDPPSNWKLHLSRVYWLLVLLRSPTVRSLHQDDAPVLHHLQQGIDKNPDIAGLRALVTGAIDWETFSGSKEYDIAMTTAGEYLDDIARRAEILCATPADSENDKSVKMFKLHAKGFAIDEAYNMKRPDLYCTWGNTLSPLFVFGDRKQLRPAVIMLTELWPNSKKRPGEFINRFARDAQISALEYLQASGIPTYRYDDLDTTKASD
ncbi:hypothetical protein FPSE_10528 [Fusarium pseudograminearum CS3096]|uniref:Uncharacterized protein n=1 Tax=Fusarium pseudograminearum (strain CS3096) TaxID=1028729 RepID=K3VXP8_FUSPC|nr:hypothetical protein FPSE_10528 [Fusarium pseudograminearum CS3096]EKJ69275.1 hypothetical protein FPSE_10528 [Fusarium pseudograminearum CS3096]